jgi:hypothetical protein
MAKIASSNPNSAHPLNEGVKYFGRSMSGSGQTVMMAPKHDFRSSPNTDIIGSDRHVSNVKKGEVGGHYQSRVSSSFHSSNTPNKVANTEAGTESEHERNKVEDALLAGTRSQHGG